MAAPALRARIAAALAHRGAPAQLIRAGAAASTRTRPITRAENPGATPAKGGSSSSSQTERSRSFSRPGGLDRSRSSTTSILPPFFRNPSHPGLLRLEQGPQGPHQAALDGPLGDPQGGGDLLALEALELGQHEDGALP